MNMPGNTPGNLAVMSPKREGKNSKVIGYVKRYGHNSEVHSATLPPQE
jgi:hypothetical protein